MDGPIIYYSIGQLLWDQVDRLRPVFQELQVYLHSYVNSHRFLHWGEVSGFK